MDILAFITAQLDADEAAAKKPWGLDWRAEGSPGRMGVVDADMAEPLILDGNDDGTIEFCVHFQPRRMLADIAAKRAILERHKPDGDPDGDECSTCWGVNDYSDDNAPQGFPCETVRLLAAQFADRPGFNPPWRINV